MKTIAALAIALLSCTAANAQQWDQEISRIFAEDGMSVELLGRETSGARERYGAVAVEVPGHMRIDGWFIGPMRALLGPVTRNAENVRLPRLTLPIRKTEIAFHEGVIEGFEPAAGGLLDQHFDRIVFEPVTISKDDGVFVSVDRLTIVSEEDCFSIEATGLAISATKTLPEIAKAGNDFYKGDARVVFDCTPGLWTLTGIEADLDGLGRLDWSGRASFSPQAMLDDVAADRTAMNAMYSEDPNILDIMIADAMVYLAAAEAVSIPRFSFEFIDAGAAAAINGALDEASWLGLRDVGIGRIVSAFPESLRPQVDTALRGMLDGDGTLSIAMEWPEATAKDLALGAIPASAWTIEAKP